MAAMCALCGKHSQFGKSYTHHRGVAGGRWKKRAQKTNRVFRVNLQRVTIDENGFQMQIRLCGKCIKRIKKDTIEGKRPFVKLIHINPPVKKVSESIDVPAVAA
ncbi:hypothetical protein A2690_04510 [Candidatus Roizmanbacteria bacterium RIFCSPHIGHO2_01_FULL_39_12b]|uniref:50S ribosomal protein L28 n=1 Tax=Candidatus Roizmanbacteria bacterium RIFCSPHIGHO2_01_FULL_39_12b TaxID=1802030 RepID=A0A1F7GAF6_9BACT|nr:MAG: hypothetical protein A2690_04510 [Candidatus Roizmanbacteria bacterium RIFCSPHIGHO2_01_FULL_39_12b]